MKYYKKDVDKKYDADLLFSNGINYIFDTNDFENEELYYCIKEKNNYSFGYTDDELIAHIYEPIIEIAHPLLCRYSNIVMPESSHDFLSRVFGVYRTVGMNVHILKKNSKEYISKKVLEENRFSREELESHNKRFEKMGDTFKINKIKANKRHLYEKHMFKTPNMDFGKDTIIIDDFVSTGSTIRGLKHIVGDLDVFAVFYKAKNKK